MKRRLTLVLVIVFTLFVSTTTLAFGIGESVFSPPVIATAMGDGTGSFVLEILSQRNGLEYTNMLALTAEILEEILLLDNSPRTLLLATGVLVESDICTVCGDAEMDIEKEVKRIEDLIVLARESGLLIVGMHIVEAFPTPERSYEQSISLIMPRADLILLVSPGGADEYFRNLSEVNGIPLISVNSAMELGGALQAIFPR